MVPNEQLRLGTICLLERNRLDSLRCRRVWWRPGRRESREGESYLRAGKFQALTPGGHCQAPLTFPF